MEHVKDKLEVRLEKTAVLNPIQMRNQIAGNADGKKIIMTTIFTQLFATLYFPPSKKIIFKLEDCNFIWRKNKIKNIRFCWVIFKSVYFFI